jgi:hypothetical protein
MRITPVQFIITPQINRVVTRSIIESAAHKQFTTENRCDCFGWFYCCRFCLPTLFCYDLKRALHAIPLVRKNWRCLGKFFCWIPFWARLLVVRFYMILFCGLSLLLVGYIHGYDAHSGVMSLAA